MFSSRPIFHFEIVEAAPSCNCVCVCVCDCVFWYSPPNKKVFFFVQFDFSTEEKIDLSAAKRLTRRLKETRPRAIDKRPSELNANSAKLFCQNFQISILLQLIYSRSSFRFDSRKVHKNHEWNITLSSASTAALHCCLKRKLRLDACACECESRNRNKFLPAGIDQLSKFIDFSDQWERSDHRRVE